MEARMRRSDIPVVCSDIPVVFGYLMLFLPVVIWAAAR
jgi:hypothetical protein